MRVSHSSATSYRVDYYFHIMEQEAVVGMHACMD